MDIQRDPNSQKGQWSQPSGYATNASDCNDGSSSINPSASEVCDGADNNCNGSIDEGIALLTWYLDGDGFGSSPSIQSCSQPSSYVSNSSDCNDGSALVNPGQSAYFTSPTGSFDYNCNGVAEPQVGNFWQLHPISCTLCTPGWISAIPACGATGLYATSCVFEPLIAACVPNIISTTQACR